MAEVEMEFDSNQVLDVMDQVDDSLGFDTDMVDGQGSEWPHIETATTAVGVSDSNMHDGIALEEQEDSDMAVDHGHDVDVDVDVDLDDAQEQQSNYAGLSPAVHPEKDEDSIHEINYDFEEPTEQKEIQQEAKSHTDGSLADVQIDSITTEATSQVQEPVAKPGTVLSEPEVFNSTEEPHQEEPDEITWEEQEEQEDPSGHQDSVQSAGPPLPTQNDDETAPLNQRENPSLQADEEAQNEVHEREEEPVQVTEDHVSDEHVEHVEHEEKENHDGIVKNNEGDAHHDNNEEGRENVASPRGIQDLEDGEAGTGLAGEEEPEVGLEADMSRSVEVNSPDDVAAVSDFPDITVCYKGDEFPLFSSTSDGFFSESSILDETMASVLVGLRQELNDEILSEDELVFHIDELGLEFAESSPQDLLSGTTLRQILEIFDLLVKNQDPDTSRTLYTYLFTRADAGKRLEFLIESATAGKALDEIIHLFEPLVPATAAALLDIDSLSQEFHEDSDDQISPVDENDIVSQEDHEIKADADGETEEETNNVGEDVHQDTHAVPDQSVPEETPMEHENEIIEDDHEALEEQPKDDAEHQNEANGADDEAPQEQPEDYDEDQNEVELGDDEAQQEQSKDYQEHIEDHVDESDKIIPQGKDVVDEEVNGTSENAEIIAAESNQDDNIAAETTNHDEVNVDFEDEEADPFVNFDLVDNESLDEREGGVVDDAVEVSADNGTRATSPTTAILHGSDKLDINSFAKSDAVNGEDELAEIDWRDPSELEEVVPEASPTTGKRSRPQEDEPEVEEEQGDTKRRRP